MTPPGTHERAAATSPAASAVVFLEKLIFLLQKAGSLFLRGLERSERIHNAMLSRGYDGTIRSISVRPLDGRSRLLVVMVLAALIVLLLLGYSVA